MSAPELTRPENTVDATFYVLVQRTSTGAKALRLSQGKPYNPPRGTVTCSLTLRLPKSAFLPPIPVALIVIPEDMIDSAPPVEVEASDAS